MKTRRSAFTLVELVVALAISSTIISIAIGVYLNFQNIFSSFVRANTEDLELLSLYTSLHREFELAKEINGDQDEITIDVEDKTIRYSFFPDYIVRINSEVSDTFYVSVDVAVEPQYRELPLLKTVSLTTILSNEEINIRLEKDYERAVLFNNEVENGI